MRLSVVCQRSRMTDQIGEVLAFFGLTILIIHLTRSSASIIQFRLKNVLCHILGHLLIKQEPPPRIHYLTLRLFWEQNSLLYRGVERDER